MEAHARLWRVEAEAFAVIDAAFGISEVLVSEAEGRIVCLSLDGECVCRWRTPDGANLVHASWVETLQAWAGVLLFFEEGPRRCLVLLDRQGELVSQVDIPSALGYAFTASGSLLVSGRGQVLSVPDGEVIWTFADE